MKLAPWIAVAAGLAAPAVAAPPSPTASPPLVQAAEVKSYVGKTVVVDAAVSGIHHARSGSSVMLDMNGVYPSNAFTAVVFKSDLGKFSNLDALSGKTVRISGKVKIYRGKPEIVLSDPNQIKLAARTT